MIVERKRIQYSKEVLTGYDNKGKVNKWTCEKGHEITVIHKDGGITPMFLQCEICGGRATSQFYKVPDGLTPSHEWWRPKFEDEVLSEVKSWGLSAPENIDGAYRRLLEHLKDGGLSLRKIPNVDAQRMREIGEKIKGMLPEGVGFCLHTFPLENTGMINYISNAQRKDMIEALKFWLNDKLSDIPQPESN